MEKNNVLDVPKNDLFLIEDANGDMTARFQKI